MSILEAYLQSPKTKRVLARKPGEQGFSLIELVVVVAVLAILAAIAVPAYTNMNQRAADSAVLTNLKNAYKECAYQVANAVAAPDYDEPGNDSYYTYTKPANCGTASAPNTLTATRTAIHSGGAGTLSINLITGAKGQTGSATW